MGLRIIIGEQDFEIYERMREVLSGLGHQVTWAKDGRSTLEASRRDRPDLVFVDALAPEMAGVAVCRRLVTEVGPEIKCVVISETAPEHAKATNGESAVTAYVAKDVDPRGLAVLVERVAPKAGRSAAQTEEDESLLPVPDVESQIGLEGSLTEVGFGRLLHFIRGKQPTGCLEVSHSSVLKRIYVDKGEPVYVTSNIAAESLGRYLLSEGDLTLEQYAEALKEVLSTGRAHSDVLIERGFLSPHVLVEAMERLAREKLVQVFSWPGGQYKFQKGAFEIGGEHLARFDLYPVLHEGVRRHYNLTRLERFFKKHKRHVPALASKDGPWDTALDPAERQFVSHIDGQSTFKRLAANSNLNVTRTFQLLYYLTITGATEFKGIRQPAARPPRKRPRPAGREMSEYRQLIEHTYDMLPSLDHFQVLGLSRPADPGDVRAAYLAMTRQFRPYELYGDASRIVKEKADRIFQRLTDAYETLQAEEKQREYLRESHAGQEADRIERELLEQSRAGQPLDVEVRAEPGPPPKPAEQAPAPVEKPATFDEPDEEPAPVEEPPSFDRPIDGPAPLDLPDVEEESAAHNEIPVDDTEETEIAAAAPEDEAEVPEPAPVSVEEMGTASSAEPEPEPFDEPETLDLPDLDEEPPDEKQTEPETLDMPDLDEPVDVEPTHEVVLDVLASAETDRADDVDSAEPFDLEPEPPAEPPSEPEPPAGPPPAPSQTPPLSRPAPGPPPRSVLNDEELAELFAEAHALPRDPDATPVDHIPLAETQTDARVAEPVPQEEGQLPAEEPEPSVEEPEPEPSPVKEPVTEPESPAEPPVAEPEELQSEPAPETTVREEPFPLEPEPVVPAPPAEPKRPASPEPPVPAPRSVDPGELEFSMVEIGSDRTGEQRAATGYLARESREEGEWVATDPGDDIQRLLSQGAEVTTEMANLLKSELKYQQGERLFLAGDYAAAARRFEEAVQANPKEAEYLAYLGWSIFHVDPHDKPNALRAKNTIEQALSMNPMLDRAHFYLGQIAVSVRNYPLAKKHFERAVQFNPDNQSARRELERLEPLL